MHYIYRCSVDSANFERISDFSGVFKYDDVVLKI